MTADLKTLKSGVFNTVVLNSIRFLLEIVMVLLFLLLIFLAFINDYNINDLLTYLIFWVCFIRLLPSVNKFMVVLIIIIIMANLLIIFTMTYQI